MTKPKAVTDYNDIYVNDADGTISGNLLANDFDVDGDTLYLRFLDGVRVGAKGTDTVEGEYGTFKVYGDGSYTYTLDADDPMVQALKSGETLVEKVTYKISSSTQETDFDYLYLTIHGPNSKPQANEDTANVDTAGNASGNVLTNDFDLEGSTGLFVGRGGTASTLNFVSDSGLTVHGVYGDLTIYRDGHYTYDLNEADSDTIALNGAHAEDVFRYRLADGAFGEVADNSNTTDIGYLHINI